jgi:hypothetical protein
LLAPPPVDGGADGGGDGGVERGGDGGVDGGVDVFAGGGWGGLPIQTWQRTLHEFEAVALVPSQVRPAFGPSPHLQVPLMQVVEFEQDRVKASDEVPPCSSLGDALQAVRAETTVKPTANGRWLRMTDPPRALERHVNRWSNRGASGSRQRVSPYEAHDH